MKHGHVTGHKRERRSSGDWYRAQEEANIQHVEATWKSRPIAEHCLAKRISDGQHGLAHLRRDGKVAFYPQHLHGINYVCQEGELAYHEWCDSAGNIVPA